MTYNLIITERANELLDKLVFYLLYQLKNEQAASHFLDGVAKIYDRVVENPFQFPQCRDSVLKRKEYREAVIPDMNYLVTGIIQCSIFVRMVRKQ
ncbi:MAG: type II toxin-antitoxin system RelE/ParE family toxin [Faecalimonas sp.]|nr:type II toxin-antitoxin system RelE/ParE family toxin [Faecalimonas sp.]